MFRTCWVFLCLLIDYFYIFISCSKHPPIIKKHLKMASPFIENKRVRIIAIARNDASFSLD